MRRLGHVSIFALAAGLSLFVAPAYGHPMGNFSINHYAGIHARADGLFIQYVLDIAEVPTFQELGHLDATEIERHLDARLMEWTRGLRLSTDASAVTLLPIAARVACLPGAGGLPTLRIETDLWAGFENIALPSNATQTAYFVYRDTNFRDQLGWKEILVTGQGVGSSSVPAADRGTDMLRRYPTDMKASPGDLEATFSVRASGNTRGPSTMTTARDAKTFDLTNCRPSGHASGWTTRISGSRPASGDTTAFGALFRRLSDGPSDARVFAIALLGAVALGAYHALTPGHGKTILAAYFVGSRGTPVQAVLLGAVVTLTHTSGVFLLGIAALFASRYVLAERLYPWFSALSGAMLVGVGISLFRRRLQRLRRVTDQPEDAYHHHRLYPQGTGEEKHQHIHPHEQLQDAHQHDHVHEYHRHLPPEETIRVRDLVTLGITGGLLPCPSALVVMLAAISVGQVTFGLVLITAFSVGLAAVLTAGGLLMVYAREVMRRLVERKNDGAASAWPTLLRPAIQRLPVVSAAVVALIGLAIIFETIPSLSAAP
jgi:ABC-type nickel/cobalt efflux system permease component RcnA